jgi:hypothetical protein
MRPRRGAARLRVGRAETGGPSCPESACRSCRSEARSVPSCRPLSPIVAPHPVSDAGPVISRPGSEKLRRPCCARLFGWSSPSRPKGGNRTKPRYPVDGSGERGETLKLSRLPPFSLSADWKASAVMMVAGPRFGPVSARQHRACVRSRLHDISTTRVEIGGYPRTGGDNSQLANLLEFKPLAQKSHAIKHLAESPRKGSNPVTHPN